MKQAETPLLCVVTTIYHARRYLPIALNMMARQKCKRFIHVIYVGGDSENYDDIIEGYKHSCGGTDNRWPDIRFVRGTHNLGCDLAHRYCFAHLPEKCTHFCWLDAGDWVDASFVGRFYKRYRFHRDGSWFHFNSIHYDKETALSVGKDPYHSFNKSLLRKKEQLPAFAFRQFYYHVMVIEKSAFREINPKCELFGLDVHQGAFYDSPRSLFLSFWPENGCYTIRNAQSTS